MPLSNISLQILWYNDFFSHKVFANQSIDLIIVKKIGWIKQRSLHPINTTNLAHGIIILTILVITIFCFADIQILNSLIALTVTPAIAQELLDI